eukprot:1145636-Pelagomonas_calceolata.AAC.8
MSTSLQFPLWGTSALHILPGCISKAPLGAGLASMGIGNADCLASQNRRATRTKPRDPLRSRGVRRGNREHSAPATATAPAFKVRYPSQLLPGQRHIYLVEVKYCEDTRPKKQLEASKQQHWDLCNKGCNSCNLSRASAQVTLHTILLGVSGVIYTPHILEPLKELGLDTHTATKLTLKLHAHSVQYACKLVRARRAHENMSLNSRHQDQARATASNPPGPH